MGSNLHDQYYIREQINALIDSSNIEEEIRRIDKGDLSEILKHCIQMLKKNKESLNG